MIPLAADWSPVYGPAGDSSVPQWIADVYEGDEN